MNPLLLDAHFGHLWVMIVQRLYTAVSAATLGHDTTDAEQLLHQWVESEPDCNL